MAISDKDSRLFRIGLYKLCESLHMGLNGSSDPLPPTEEKEIVEYLRGRLQRWGRSLSPNAKYDDAMRELVCAALAEHSVRRAGEEW